MNEIDGEGDITGKYLGVCVWFFNRYMNLIGKFLFLRVENSYGIPIKFRVICNGMMIQISMSIGNCSDIVINFNHSKDKCWLKLNLKYKYAYKTNPTRDLWYCKMKEKN